MKIKQMNLQTEIICVEFTFFTEAMHQMPMRSHQDPTPSIYEQLYNSVYSTNAAYQSTSGAYGNSQAYSNNPYPGKSVTNHRYT